jgi:hypothetical protein
MGGTGSATGDAILNSVTFGGFTNNKKLYSDANNSLVLLNGALVNGQPVPDLTVDSGGSFAALGNITTYGQLFTADGQGGGAGLRRVPRSNSTTTNPGVSNDTTQGYSVGSRWANTTTGQFFSCYDVTTGAAVWVAMDTADHPGYLSGGSYILAPQTATAAIVPTGDTTAFFSPFFVKSRVTVNQMGMRVTTAGSSTPVASAVKYAIYANNTTTTTVRPTGAPLAFSNSGTSTSTANINIRQTVLNAASERAVLVPGVMYWAASKHTGTTLPFTTMVGSSSTTNAILLGLPILSSTVQYIGLTAPQDYVTNWPDASGLTFSPANGSSSIPLLEMVAL